MKALKWIDLIEEHREDLADAILDAYRTVTLDSDIQVSVYLWSDGEVELFEDFEGSRTRLEPNTREERELHCVAFLSRPGYSWEDVWGFDGDPIPEPGTQEWEEARDRVVEDEVNQFDAYGVIDEDIDELRQESIDSIANPTYRYAVKHCANTLDFPLSARGFDASAGLSGDRYPITVCTYDNRKSAENSLSCERVAWVSTHINKDQVLVHFDGHCIYKELLDDDGDLVESKLIKQVRLPECFCLEDGKTKYRYRSYGLYTRLTDEDK